MRDFSTDRTDETESPYTVDAVHFQYETDIFKITRSKIGAVKTIENKSNTANIKLGITNSLDIQFVVTSFTSLSITERNRTQKHSGFGSVIIRVKQNIWGNDKGKTALTILPFIDILSKFLGDEVSGGLVIPFSVVLPND